MSDECLMKGKTVLSYFNEYQAGMRKFTLARKAFVVYNTHYVMIDNLVYFTLAQRKYQRDIHPLQGLPLYGEDATENRGKPTIFRILVWLASLCPAGEP